MEKFIALESVLDIYDTRRVWYYIPGFNGYELSNDGYIRSLKHYKRYPFGILIRAKLNPKDGNDPIFELSNNNNERINISRSQIFNLVKENKRQITGYPRLTVVTDYQSRNPRELVHKKYKEFDKTPRAPKFTIIDENIKL